MTLVSFYLKFAMLSVNSIANSVCDVFPIELNLKVKMILDAENPLSLERHKAKGLKG